MSLVRRLTYILLFLMVALPLSAQTKERADSLVRLMSAQTAQLLEKNGVSYRKVLGPARFLHNDTYLICDSALWNLSTNIIHAVGNVKIMQEETVLSGDNLDYLVDEDLAQFRGLVQLEDKDKNTLRTHFLDYNTKDSVAVFQNGGSMRDKDGQIIESRGGTYDSKINLFTFTDNVNMFSDSTFIKTSRLTYNTDTGMATFTTATDVWNSYKMLSAGGGYYDRAHEIFFFRNNVHMMSEAQEGWADTLYYYRNIGDLDLMGKVQMVDTTRNVAGFAEKLHYEDSTSTITMTRNAAIMIRQENESQIDTTWVGADTLRYRSIMMCDVDSIQVVIAGERLKDLASDPVYEIRKQTAERAAKAAADARAISPDNPDNAMIPREVLATATADTIEELRKNYAARQNPDSDSGGADSKPAKNSSKKSLRSSDTTLDTTVPDIAAEPDVLPDEPVLPEENTPIVDSIALMPAIQDSLASVLPPMDSLAISESGQIDSLMLDIPEVPEVPEVKDTTKIGFAWAFGHVKIHRQDMQVACDSLAYNDLDSLARFYKQPLIWNDGNRQYAADSIMVSIKGQNLDRARLMSNAFITIKEDTDLYDQIRSTEMMAYFDTTGALKRFDALGGATALFYLQENDTYATVNKVDSKILSAQFADGEIDRVYYYENVKNDGFPLAQMSKVDRELKGFSWQMDEKCPKGPEDITTITFRKTERDSYEAHPRPVFPYSESYFPGYIKDIQEKIRKGEIARRNAAQSSSETSQDQTADELAHAEVMDSVQVEETVDDIAAVGDDQNPTLSVKDSTVVSVPVVDVDSEEAESADELQLDEKALKKQQRQDAKAAKIAAREKRWADLDAKDARKAEAKAQKALERKRKKTLKMLQKMDVANDKDATLLQKYEERYRKKAGLSKSGGALIEKPLEEVPDDLKGNPWAYPIDEEPDGIQVPGNSTPRTV